MFQNRCYFPVLSSCDNLCLCTYIQNILSTPISYHNRYLMVYDVKIKKKEISIKNYLLIIEKLEETQKYKEEI